MKKGVFIIFLFIICSASAQQLPIYTQYVMNTFVLNPAVAGIENYWDVKASRRQQWVGLDGAPTTTYFTAQGPLKKSYYDNREDPTSFHPEGDNPRGHAYWEDYGATDPHAGAGITIINDATGPINHFSACGTLSYHIPLAKQTSLSAGLSGGAQEISLNSDKLNFGMDYPVDPAVAGSGYLDRWKPLINAGLWLYSKEYFVGFSAQNIVPSDLAFSDDTLKVQNGKLIPHLFLMAGYRIPVTDDINFLPSVLVRYVDPVPVGFDINGKFQYRDLLWVGASFRHKDGFAAMLGINISNSVNIGYSYDYVTSPLNSVSYGTHELLVGFLIGNSYGDWCPRNLW